MAEALQACEAGLELGEGIDVDALRAIKCRIHFEQEVDLKMAAKLAEIKLEQKLGEGLVVEIDHRQRRRSAALSIALVTLVLLFFFVTLVRFESLEMLFASAVWIVVCLPMAALVDRWGIVGFIVGIPVCMILTPVAFLVTFGVAVTLGIEVMPVPN